MLVLFFLRRKRNLTQQHVCRVLGIFQSRYSLIERGKISPDVPEARKLEQFFGHPVQKLLEEVCVVSKAQKEYLVQRENKELLFSVRRQMKKESAVWEDDNKRSVDEALSVVSKDLRRRERRLREESESI